MNSKKDSFNGSYRFLCIHDRNTRMLRSNRKGECEKYAMVAVLGMSTIR